ncbi:hypothetical protein ACFL1B_03135 [Nanoarchaeota archaeon]
MRKRIILIVVLLLTLAVALAQNDPGHDSLYIEQVGDSALNGTLNISENLTVRGGELEISNMFEIHGDGQTPGSNINYITGSLDNYISINSLGNGQRVQLMDDSALGQVLIGDSATGSIDLNVSNDLFVLGDLVSLGTIFELRTDDTLPTTTHGINVNSTGASAKMWLTSQEIILAQGIANAMVHVGRAAGDAVALNVTGDVYFQSATATIEGSQICTLGNGLCGGASSGAGWTNTSTTTSTDLNVKVGGTDFFVNSTSGNVGIGTVTPAETLTVIGNANITQMADFQQNITVRGGGILDNQGTGRIEFTSNKVIIRLG